MVDKESDIRPIGYGAMLCEGLVGVMALIAATSLHPGDYYAINTPPAVYQTLRDAAGMPLAMTNLRRSAGQVGENVIGRTGGGVSLAIGMAEIFSRLPGMRGLMAYWYHFAIMFEALFILTTIDAGTRVARFALQEFIGRAWKPFGRADWLPGSIMSTAHDLSGVGLLHLDRQHRHDLADVRRRQPAARERGAGRRHDDPDQHGPREVHVGDVRAAVLRGDDDADGGLPERSRQLLAESHRPGPGACGAGLCGRHLHRRS